LENSAVLWGKRTLSISVILTQHLTALEIVQVKTVILFPRYLSIHQAFIHLVKNEMLLIPFSKFVVMKLCIKKFQSKRRGI
jgi:hypothetical protein